MGRVWLDVPYAEKDQAKAAGARWDPAARRWYASRPGMAALDRWAAAPGLPEVLPGEDRSFGSGLFVDLVPRSCWFTNARSCLSRRDWERLRRMVTGRAANRCEICGATSDPATRKWLEVHERWAYDQARKVQSLRRLICLCTACHRCTHFGLAELQGHRDEALSHLMTVNGWEHPQAERHISAAWDTWTQRSAELWELDLSVLTAAGISVNPPPDAATRQDKADMETARARSDPAPDAFLSAPAPPQTPSPQPAEAVPPPARKWWQRPGQTEEGR